MKNNKGFTLIELVAVIILVGLIALIITPKITKVLKTQKMNIFKESVEGIVKAVKEDAVNNASFNSTTTSNYRAYIYDGTGLYLTVAGNKAADADIKISGNIDNGQGTVVVTKDSDVVLAVYNDKFCAKKNADDTSITVENYSGTCVNDEIDIPEATSCFIYENNPDNTLTITGYNYNDTSCSKDLVIPNRINGKLVSKLASFAFVDAEVKIVDYSENDENGKIHYYTEYASNFHDDKEVVDVATFNAADITGKRCFTDTDENTSVSVDVNYVHTAGDGYYGCSFQMPGGPDSGMLNNYKFTSIDFSHATALTKIPFGLIPFSSVGSVSIGDYITEIGTMAFTKNYINSLAIPKNIITISDFAFQENQINNVDFTNAQNLKTIKTGAFCENNINSVNIHDLNNLESIGGGWWGAFEENQITSVTLKNLPSLTNIGNIEDEYGPFNYNNISTLVLDNIPNLKVFGGQAFYSNNLSAVTLPSTITTLGPSAFADNSLTAIVMPNSLTTIGDNAFSENNISSITFPNNITSLGDGVFSQNALTSITIPSTITTLGDGAFADNSLTEIVIPDSVTTIGEYAFSENSIASVTFSNAITSIGAGVFYKNALTSLTIPSTITTIGDKAFSENALTSLTIPNTVTSIGPNAFSKNAITSVTIPTSVTSIGDSAFYQNQLSSIAIPNNVTNIGISAFQYNNILQGSATIDNASANVTLGANAFINNGADRLTVITPVFLR